MRVSPRPATAASVAVSAVLTTRRERIFERYAVVVFEIVRPFGNAAAREVCGACADDTSDAADLLGDQTVIVQVADAQAEVDMLLDQVHSAVDEHHANVDIRVLLDEVDDDWKQIEPAQGDRRR